jgi:hypothetical protein
MKVKLEITAAISIVAFIIMLLVNLARTTTVIENVPANFLK